MPNIAVVIPISDRTRLLIETIRSVLAQTVRPREIIVVDNGLAGHAAALTTRFDSAVRCIRSLPGEKQLARNAGIAAARSDWIATLDDNDLWEPDYLRVASRAISSGNANIIGTNHVKSRGRRVQTQSKFEEAPAGYWNAVPRLLDGEEWSLIGSFLIGCCCSTSPSFRHRLLFDVGWRWTSAAMIRA